MLPVFKLIVADVPWPELIQAHLSPFSFPVLSSQPELVTMSISVSAHDRLLMQSTHTLLAL